MEARNVIGEESGREVEGLSQGIRGPERKGSWWGKWGLLTLQVSCRTGTRPQGSRGLSERGCSNCSILQEWPEREGALRRGLQTCSWPRRAGRCPWLTDLGYLGGSETWKCPLSLENFL